ncbi:MAG: hypothetical protein K2P53_04500 [Rickettsiales bacterium]|jgi:hypothetical protein|nr:hypothetical protein [Rickettsiales bacterium]
MAIIFNNKSDFRNYAIKAHPDKVDMADKEIATGIFSKVSVLDVEAKIQGYPFKYLAEKNEYCFLTKIGYQDKEIISDHLQDMYKNKCEELQKHNFSFERQILILEDLKNVKADKYTKIINSHCVLNVEEEYKDSELNDALLCIQGISGEC